MTIQRCGLDCGSYIRRDRGHDSGARYEVSVEGWFQFIDAVIGCGGWKRPLRK